MLLTALAVLVRHQFSAVVEKVAPFLPFVTAMTLAAAYGGFGPGLAATTLCTIAAVGWFGPAAVSSGDDAPAWWLATTVLFATGALISAVCEAMHRARRRVEAEQENLRASDRLLQESEARERARVQELEAVLAAVPAAIWIAQDPECRRITGSRAAHDILRLPDGANLSKSAPDPGATEHFRVLKDGFELRPEDLPMQRAARGEEVRGFEEEIAFADGTRRTLFGNAVPLFDPKGEVRGAVGAFVDVSDRKLVEETLRQADRRKDDFLALLAHELRNPLAPIRNSLEILKHCEGDPGMVWQTRTMMERQLAHIVRLVDDLLDLSRINRDRLELRRERVDLAAVISSAVESTHRAIDCDKHELFLALPRDPVELEADPVRLAQVFSNLIANACKFTEPGGRISIVAEREGREAVVRVKDTGCGITADELPKIFDLFAQPDRPLERAQGGLGLGLTLVRRLLQMHGGRVEAASPGKGQGSEFTVRLPLPASAPQARPAPTAGATAAAEPQRPPPLPKRRILVVDDNRDAAESTAAMLRLMGAEVRTAHDGLAALEAATEYRPELILLDLGMPKLNGYEAARRIRELPELEDVALVAVTGWGQEHDQRRSREAGFDRHMVKPVEPNALLNLLRTLPPRSTKVSTA